MPAWLAHSARLVHRSARRAPLANSSCLEGRTVATPARWANSPQLLRPPNVRIARSALSSMPARSTRLLAVMRVRTVQRASSQPPLLRKLARHAQLAISVVPGRVIASSAPPGLSARPAARSAWRALPGRWPTQTAPRARCATQANTALPVAVWSALQANTAKLARASAQSARRESTTRQLPRQLVHPARLASIRQAWTSRMRFSLRKLLA